jgi:hypothetical protein
MSGEGLCTCFPWAAGSGCPSINFWGLGGCILRIELRAGTPARQPFHYLILNRETNRQLMSNY